MHTHDITGDGWRINPTQWEPFNGPALALIIVDTARGSLNVDNLDDA